MNVLTEKYANTRFLVIVEGERKWMTFWDCVATIESGFVRVADGRLALDITGSGTERPLTEEEKRDINNAADDWSGNK